MTELPRCPVFPRQDSGVGDSHPGQLVQSRMEEKEEGLKEGLMVTVLELPWI